MIYFISLMAIALIVMFAMVKRKDGVSDDY